MRNEQEMVVTEFTADEALQYGLEDVFKESKSGRTPGCAWLYNWNAKAFSVPIDNLRAPDGTYKNYRPKPPKSVVEALKAKGMKFASTRNICPKSGRDSIINMQVPIEGLTQISHRRVKKEVKS